MCQHLLTGRDQSSQLCGAGRLERVDGIVIRFVVGHSADAELERGMAAEEAAHGDFMRLPFQARIRAAVHRVSHPCRQSKWPSLPSSAAVHSVCSNGASATENLRMPRGGLCCRR